MTICLSTISGTTDSCLLVFRYCAWYAAELFGFQHSLENHTPTSYLLPEEEWKLRNVVNDLCMFDISGSRACWSYTWGAYMAD